MMPGSHHPDYSLAGGASALSTMRTPPGLRSSPARKVTIARLALVLLVAGIMTSGLVIQVGDSALYLERGVNLLILGYMLVSFLSDRQQFPGRSLLLLWLSWSGVNLVSVLLTNDPVPHLSTFLLTLLPPSVFWLVTRFRFDPAFVSSLVRATLWVNGIAGVGALALRAAGYEIPLFFDYIERLRLFVFEPNLLGSALGCLAFLALPRAKFNLPTIILAILTMICFAASASKMPFIAFGICALLYLGFRATALRRGGTSALIAAFWLGLLAIVGGLAFSTSLEKVYETSLQRSDAVGVRLYLFRLAVDRFEDKPVLGNGSGDFRLQNPDFLKQFGQTETTADHLWIGNMFLAIAHDTGIVGLAFYLVFLAALTLYGLRCIRAGSLDHCGYLAAFLLIVLCCQASTVHLNAIFGLTAGLVALAPLARQRPGARVPRARPVGGRT